MGKIQELHIYPWLEPFHWKFKAQLYSLFVGTSELHCVVGTCSPTSKWQMDPSSGAIDQSHDDGGKFRFTELISEVLTVYTLASCLYSKKTKDSGETMKEQSTTWKLEFLSLLFEYTQNKQRQRRRQTTNN